jgi:hypothetical protein
MVAGGYTLSLSVCVLAVYSGIKRTPGTPLNTRRGSGEREAKSSTAQQLKRRRRVGLGTWRERSMAIDFCCLKGPEDRKRTPRLDILTSPDVGLYREEERKKEAKNDVPHNEMISFYKGEREREGGDLRREFPGFFSFLDGARAHKVQSRQGRPGVSMGLSQCSDTTAFPFIHFFYSK